MSDTIGTATLTAYTLPDELAYDDWCALGAALGQRAQAQPWLVGDWLVYGAEAYGEQHAQALDVTGLAPATLIALAWVARQIPPARRVADISWSHHREVAALDADTQTAWLLRVGADGLAIAALRRELEAAGLRKVRRRPERLARLERLYRTLTADERVAFRQWLETEGDDDGEGVATGAEGA